MRILSQPRSPGKDTSSPVKGPVIAAVIGGIAVIVAAFITGAYNGHSVGLGARPAVTVTVTVTVSRQTGSGGSGTRASPGTPLSVYSHEPVGIDENGLDFDSNPPSVGGANIYYVFFTLSTEDSSTEFLALWTQSGTPTASQCMTWVTTHPGSSITNITVGMQICIKTDQGRYGLLQVASGTSSTQMEATATIWAS